MNSRGNFPHQTQYDHNYPQDGYEARHYYRKELGLRHSVDPTASVRDRIVSDTERKIKEKSAKRCYDYAFHTVFKLRQG